RNAFPSPHRTACQSSYLWSYLREWGIPADSICQTPVPDYNAWQFPEYWPEPREYRQTIPPFPPECADTAEGCSDAPGADRPTCGHRECTLELHGHQTDLH